jgi:para-aminobenzoate synthetase component 1
LCAAVRRAAGGTDCVWLDGSASDRDFGQRWSRFGLIATRPIAVLSQVGTAPAQFEAAAGTIATGVSGWRLWADLHAGLAAASAAIQLPSTEDAGGAGPGWFGTVGYEMVRWLEAVPVRPPPLGLPNLRLLLCDQVISLDMQSRSARLTWAPDLAGRLGLPATDCDAVAGRWNAETTDGSELSAKRPASAPPRAELVESRAAYLSAIDRLRGYIAAGDIYQANFAQPCRLHGIHDPWAAYERLRVAHPAAFGAFMAFGDAAILSISPELFLDVHGERVLTRPIKGTRPRNGDTAANARAREALLASEKDAAELAMIVDLHRNDLGRVCRAGSVRVNHARLLEEHPSVFHTLAEIEGRLAPGRTALAALQAAFPAGSISGVPKVRALEIIHELESCGRGPYCGAIGWLGLSGRMTMNVAIRTLMLRGGEGLLLAGGGIVAESDGNEEYAESLAKMRGLLSGLGATLPEAFSRESSGG